MCVGSFAMAKPPADDLLAGPAMHDETITNQDMAMEAQRLHGRIIHHDQKQKFWIATLKTIDLSQEQQTEVDALVKEYKTKEQEFQRVNGKEIAALRKAVGAARKAGDPVDETTKTRLQALMEMEPDVLSYQERVWAVLTPQQHKVFKDRYQARIAHAMKERAKRDGEKRDPMMQDMMSDGKFGPEDSPFRDKRINPKDDPYERSDDALDEASIQRIKFLRRLQHLDKDS